MSTEKDNETLDAIFFILLLVTGLIVPYIIFKGLELFIDMFIKELPIMAKMLGIAVGYIKQKLK